MRQLISLHNVNRWRMATGWDVVGGTVRGNTNHRLDLILSDGAIVHIQRDGIYSLCQFTTTIRNGPSPSVLKPLHTLPLPLPQGRVLRDHSRARPSRTAYCGRFHWRHDGTKWELVNVTRPEALPGLEEVRSLVAELAATPIGEGRRQLEERGRWEPFSEVAAAFARLPQPRPNREEIRTAGNRDLNRRGGWYDDDNRDCPPLSRWIVQLQKGRQERC